MTKPSTPPDDLPGARFTVDLKIPLWGMMTAAGADWAVDSPLESGRVVRSNCRTHTLLAF